MSPWSRHRTPSGSRFLQCAPLSAEGLAHAFTLRPESTSAAGPPGPPPDVLAALGLDGRPVSRPKQVHGRIVARPGGAGALTDPVEADGVVVGGASAPSGVAAIATADCVGAILCCARGEGFAVVHAGWRGTLLGVLQEAVAALSAGTGTPPSRMILAIGPSIGRCCYEVGEDVADPFRRAFPESAIPRLFGARNGRATLDIVEANRVRAVEAGLDPERIHAAGMCTSCERDLCWSWRAGGAAAGRMWTLAGLRSPA